MKCAPQESTYANVGNWILFFIEPVICGLNRSVCVSLKSARGNFVGQSVLDVEEK